MYVVKYKGGVYNTQHFIKGRFGIDQVDFFV